MLKTSFSTGRLAILTVMFVIAMLVVRPLYAVNAPVITHVMGKPVVAGATQYANVTTGIQIRGNAENGTIIRLFKAGSLVGTGLTDVSVSGR